MNMIDLNRPDQASNIFKVLTHPGRVAILELLRDGERCVCHLEAYLGLRQAAISQQLAVLRETGLIQDRRDGWNIYYRVVKPEIFTVLDAARSLMGSPPFIPPGSGVKCPCPHCNSQRE
jgi:ArsR family transcriptional regulator